MNIALIVATLISAILLLVVAFPGVRGSGGRIYWIALVVGVIMMGLVAVQVLVAIRRQ
jgi:hypothetical protein